ncbi:Replication fork protection component Swi3 [Perkinsela sp. CCAP 1560/4]|nr:Replication fork protection component Swi3 [Perkinsela sp. CCAP 1560/4]|eukprot:KNH06744.1 Replication fork protection component Swi3 [Perkinsela sp. CCAP 1560/4]
MSQKSEKKLPAGTFVLLPTKSRSVQSPRERTRALLQPPTPEPIETHDAGRRNEKKDFEEILFGPSGVDSLSKYADRLHLSGKHGDEMKDLASILYVYSEFFHHTFPTMTRSDVMAQLLKHSNRGLQHITSHPMEREETED